MAAECVQDSAADHPVVELLGNGVDKQTALVEKSYTGSA